MGKNIIVIGAGFAGLSAATFLSNFGYKVTILEKHNMPGGRARKFSEQGFTFDMGPSWYWMPDVFERYFASFGKKVTDYYTLHKLDPSYRVYWQQGFTDLPHGAEAVGNLLESIEPGAKIALEKFLQEAAYKYQVGVNNLVHKPAQSILEFANWAVVKGVFKLDIFNNMQQHIAKYFKHPHIKQLLEFPVLFLGALAKDTPALYSLMNYADIVGGTWYPQGGMHKIIEGMHSLAIEKNVQILFNKDVQSFGFDANNKINNITCTDATNYTADVVISAADYNFTETKLLPTHLQSYNTKYWESRKMAPSSMLFYVGLNKKLENILHHTLFFDVPFDAHANDIYVHKQYPTEPLFYMSATTVTDTSGAPKNCENLFFLIPISAGLQGDTEAIRDKYFDIIITRLEQRIGQKIKEHIIYKRSFAQQNFEQDYNAFKSNAYGLANTLMQTAILKPSLKSKKVPNLFYTGQLTTPGPGVPPSLISGEVVAKFVHKSLG